MVLTKEQLIEKHFNEKSEYYLVAGEDIEANIAYKGFMIGISEASKKVRYAIKHIPTNTFLYEDEGGAFLVNEDDGFMAYGKKTYAEEMLKHLSDLIYTEDGEYPKQEFEITEI